jgi:hypothetical protein
MSQRWMARLHFLEILKSVTDEYLALEKRLVPEYDQAIERLGGA